VEKTYILSAKSGVAFKTFERNYYLDKDGCFRLDGVVIMQKLQLKNNYLFGLILLILKKSTLIMKLLN